MNRGEAETLYLAANIILGPDDGFTMITGNSLRFGDALSLKYLERAFSALPERVWTQILLEMERRQK